VHTVSTTAYIGTLAKVNCGATCDDNVTGANAGQSVQVAAANQFYELGIAASLAIGGTVGVAVPVGVRVVNLTTEARIDGSSWVNARNNVSVTADAKDAIVSVAAGAGGGTVGVAGVVSVTVLTTTTKAFTGVGVHISADNNVVVGAHDDTRLLLLTIAAAFGYVGVGAAVGVAVLNKDTEAYVGASNTIDARAQGAGLNGVFDGTIGDDDFGVLPVNSFHGLAVQASSREDVFGFAPAIGGGFVGVAGGVGVTLIGVVVKAFVGENSLVNDDAANASQSVNVSAVDWAKTLTIAGGAAGGFVGVAGGVDIGVLNVTVQSYLGAAPS
jgi:hypothetical protein